MKTVAVTQRVDVHREGTERRDALDQRLTRWLGTAGYASVPVPNSLCVEGDAHPLLAWLEVLTPSAILLSGGNDLGEAAERDRTENHLLDWARQRKIPVLGICRGMQMMGTWAGAQLLEIPGHIASRHEIRGSMLGNVNSFHRYALDSLPADFRILASAPDGVLEAIRHVSLPWEGWMWHPEREAEFDPEHLKKLKELFL